MLGVRVIMEALDIAVAAFLAALKMVAAFLATLDMATEAFLVAADIMVVVVDLKVVDIMETIRVITEDMEDIMDVVLLQVI
jgi:hypothetical protein